MSRLSWFVRGISIGVLSGLAIAWLIVGYWAALAIVTAALVAMVIQAVIEWPEFDADDFDRVEPFRTYQFEGSWDNTSGGHTPMRDRHPFPFMIAPTGEVLPRSEGDS